MTTSTIVDIFLKGRRPYLWIVLVGLLLYSSTAFFGFTYLDDHILILENSEFLGKLSNIVEAFKQDVFHMLHEYDAAYRPVLTVSFMADAQLDRLLGLGYHFSNIIFHLIASCLVFLFFLRLKYSETLAFFFSLVFTVHPALTQAVAWIPGRNDSLLEIFVLASFIFLLKFLEEERRDYLIWHIVFFLLALFTKETALALMPVGALYSVFVMKEKLFSPRQIRLIAGWLFAVLLWSALRSHALSGYPVTMPFIAMLKDLARSAPAVLMYLGKAVFPVNLSVVPTIEDTTVIYGIASAVIIIAGLTVSKNKRYGMILFGAAWCISFLAPTFIRPVTGSSAIFLESRLYLPILGIFVVLGEIDAVKNVTFNNRSTLACMSAVIGFFFCMSTAYSGYFQNKTVFWECAAKRSPHSSFAQYNLGWVYNRQGRIDEAAQRYRRALELNPRQRYAHNGLGNIYETKGQPERAAAEYAMEIKNTPYYANAYRNLANIYYRQGDKEKAGKLWEQALRLNPDDMVVRKLLDMLKEKPERKR
jgi:hypothetical protein